MQNQEVKEQQIKRFKWPALLLPYVTLILLVVTYLIDQGNGNWICGPVLMLAELLFFIIQFGLGIIVWKVKSPALRKTSFGFSIGLLALLVFWFYKFITECS